MKIAIAGGSISGLAAALTLNCTGHDVHVYERSATPLRGRGGGVVVLRRMLRFLEEHGHTTRAALAVPTHRRRWLDLDGKLERDEAEMLPFSSWDSVYRSLCSMLPKDRIHYGHDVVGFTDNEDNVAIHLEGHPSVQADLLIAADGTASRLRSMLFPAYQPAYAGYLAWRGIVDEARLDADAIASLVENMTLCRGPDTLFMTFLIPALDGSLDKGKRRFNWLWYRNETDPQAIDAFLTDHAGVRHHASVAPGGLSEHSLAWLHQLANDGLPPVLSQLVSATRAPFLQSIFDALSPAFSAGRVALIGDAACTLRPHTGSGTSKASDDAVTLAESLKLPSADLGKTLSDWAANRRIAVEPLLIKGPQLAHSFGLGYPSS